MVFLCLTWRKFALLHICRISCLNTVGIYFKVLHFSLYFAIISKYWGSEKVLCFIIVLLIKYEYESTISDIFQSPLIFTAHLGPHICLMLLYMINLLFRSLLIRWVRCTCFVCDSFLFCHYYFDNLTCGFILS